MSVISQISVKKTYALRQKILRPHQNIDEVRFESDNAGSSRHYGAYKSGVLIGILSLLAEDFVPYITSLGLEVPADCVLNHEGLVFRLRGMAIDSAYRGGKIGQRLLQTAFRELCLEFEVSAIWCTARLQVKDFYLKNNFKVISPVFELPEIGEHIVMIYKH